VYAARHDWCGSQCSGGRLAGTKEAPRQARQALLDAAERLLEAHGYDRVTVAQIADAANISVKMLFTYFASKEDLAFGDEARLRDALVSAIAARPTGAVCQGSLPLMAIALVLALAMEEQPLSAEMIDVAAGKLEVSEY
jgi:AcrR family transcriptional regulator